MGTVEELARAIEDLLALDPDRMAAEELNGTVVALVREADRLAAATARLVGAWDARRIWRSDGSRSPGARLARDTCQSERSGHRNVRRARNLRDMPVVAGAVVDGRLSMDHVDLLGRAREPWRHELFARDAQVLVAQCAALPFAKTTTAVEYWCTKADAVTSPPDPTVPTGRVFMSRVGDEFVIDGALDTVAGTIVNRELRRLAKRQRRLDAKAGVERTPSERRALALTEMARRSTAMPKGARPAKPLFTVLLGDESFRHLSELAEGLVVRPGQLAPSLAAAELETVLFDGPSTVLSVSHRRSFTGALRRAIEVRDRTCQHPSGCSTLAEDCDVDHVVPHRNGGRTSQFTGRLMCATQNRHPDLRRHASDVPTTGERRIDALDVLRCRIRWRNRHWFGDGDDDPARP